MPSNEHLVLCGKVPGLARDTKHLHLNLHGQAANVHLKIHDIERRILGNIPDHLVDLLEIASYVYAADSATSRGNDSDPGMGKRWRRNFRFSIPVRLPNLWASPEILDMLTRTLSFLSEDEYEFEFRPLSQRSAVTSYFEVFYRERDLLHPGRRDNVLRRIGLIGGCD
jgi:hypothetical protein